MRHVVEALLAHGYWLLFAAVLIEQIGIPLPSVPVLLATGALAALGKISLGTALPLGVLASLLGDVPWYFTGKFRGRRVLRLLCRISLEPDSCVRGAEDTFTRRGPATLLVAKFVPGLSTVAPPLAGIIHMSFWKFLFFDGLGSLAWTTVYVLAGWFFGGQLDRLANAIAGTGRWFALLIVTPLAGWLLWKYFQRRRFIRKLRIARIEPEELKEMLDRGEPVAIIDLRHSLEDGATLPGAIHMTFDELDARSGEIPRDSDIILYCS
jgi:membrane protein DedA with SNARE-associated domain